MRKTSLGLERKYRIYGAERRGEKLVTVREGSKGRLAALTGHEAFDHEGHLLVPAGRVCDQSVAMMHRFIRPYLKNASARDLYERARPVTPPALRFRLTAILEAR